MDFNNAESVWSNIIPIDHAQRGVKYVDKQTLKVHKMDKKSFDCQWPNIFSNQET